MAIKPIGVSQLNGYIKKVLQMDPILGNLRVVGEVSNIKYHGTGHVYFSLKDNSSKINCFLPSDRARNLRYELTDGMEVIISGYLYLYEKGGTYSISVTNVEIEGVGNLSLAFEALKKKLEKEGLFKPERKKKLPTFPLKVAVVTSETGAAVRDIVSIITGRNSIVDILIYPVAVQGKGAAEEISNAIVHLNKHKEEIDVIIVGRGGGSMEELWAFNEEIVARSIANSEIPIISAVGHETDTTLADFVADRKAETPTAAAQMAVPDTRLLRENIIDLRRNSFLALRDRAEKENIKISLYVDRLKSQCLNIIREREDSMRSLKEELVALNPINIMNRGYGAILDKDGKMAFDIETFKPGDPVSIVFSSGSLDCTVNQIRRRLNEKS